MLDAGTRRERSHRASAHSLGVSIHRSLGLLAFLLSGACASFPQGRELEYPKPAAGAVVSEHPLATQVGLDILEMGGNAADAAVATAFALAVVYPEAGNLGGGGFAIWVPHGGENPRALDFRETAPSGLSAALFSPSGRMSPELARVGPLAVGVPGSPMGLWQFHQDLGELPWALVVEPAIRLARDGYRVDAWLAYHLALEGSLDRMIRNPAARRHFYPGGRALREGERHIQPALASTLERIARQGPGGFYSGTSARALVDTIQSAGGVLDLSDLERYQAKWRAPIRGWYRGYEVITMPPPSSGGLVLLQSLQLLDGFPLDSERQTDMALKADLGLSQGAGVGARAVHWWIEALRRGFADRAVHLGDPDFNTLPTSELLSADWIAQRRISIGAEASPQVGPWRAAEVDQPYTSPVPLEPVPSADGETTHLCVLDRMGNAVSLTTTLNGFFGSGMMVEELGVLLNNEMDDFALAPGVPNQYGLVGSEANSILPGKRPLSSMTPTILLDGGRTVSMVIGSPGGPRIISAVLQVVLRTLVYRQDPADALAAPRLHQQWRPVWTEFEAGWDENLLKSLDRRGHERRTMQPSRSSVQLIQLEPGGAPRAVADPRRGGVGGVEGRSLPSPTRPGPELLEPLGTPQP